MEILSEKVVLLTGATGGLGQEFTRQLLLKGCHLILSDRNLEDLKIFSKNTIIEMNPPGKILGVVAADVSSEEGCSQLVTKAYKISKKIDILINNAGIAVYGKIIDIPEKKIEQLLAINLLAPIRIARKVLPVMVASGSGHLVNISSLAGHIVGQGMSIYSVSKFGLKAFGFGVNADLKKKGIAVTNVYPSFVKTNILHSEKFGVEPGSAEIPPIMIGDPKVIIARVIKGIESKKKEIFPSFFAKFIYFLSRRIPFHVLQVRD